MRRVPTSSLALIAALCCGCYQFSGGDKKEPLQLWVYVALAGGVAAVIGVWTALSTPKDDSDRRAIGVGMAIVGAILAVLGVA
jgi:hypothetical protein